MTCNSIKEEKKMRKNNGILLFIMTIVTIVAILTGCQPADEDTNTPAVDFRDGFVLETMDFAGGTIYTKTVDTQVYKLVNGTFVTDQHWTSDAVWYLDGTTFIGNGSQNGGAVLTIDTGTTIKGLTLGVTPGLLVIQRYSQIQAIGTATEPIVFTSAQAVGKRKAGDWGGLVINGNAVTNEGINVAKQRLR